jgi:hypothetical protein
LQVTAMRRAQYLNNASGSARLSDSRPSFFLFSVLFLLIQPKLTCHAVVLI